MKLLIAAIIERAYTKATCPPARTMAGWLRGA
jgi:hypothetical protein